MSRWSLVLFSAVLLAGCAAPVPQIPIDSRSVAPGSSVQRGSDSFKLLGTPIAVGQPLPSVALFSKTLQRVDLASLKGEVLLISVVPSLDTQICERQTHQLAELKNVPAGIKRITISRDLPFAQKRFSEELPELGEIYYLSDYSDASFGRSTGLLIDQIQLLARAVLVADAQGVVRYLQVVPSITHLPDIQKGYQEALALLQ